MYSIRGKPVIIQQHAHEGLSAERPPVSIADLLEAIESPDHTDRGSGPRRRVRKWIGRRTVFVTYGESEDEIEVIACSTTRRKL